MRCPLIIAGLLVTTVLPVSAQTATPNQTQNPAPMASTSTMPMSANGEWRASKLIGVNVYNEQNEKLGDINEILLDPTGKVHGYVVGVGGFLGMGEHDVLVGINQIKFVNEAVKNVASSNMSATTTSGSATARPVRAADEKWYPDHGIMNANKDQLKAMPQFKYSSTK